MITVRLSEGVAFDMLAIAQIKWVRARSDVTQLAWLSLMDDLHDGLGHDVYHSVVQSPEYAALLEANNKVFDLIDEMHNTPPELFQGQDIDAANSVRYLAKVALQKRWFPETPIGEVKIGYDTPPAT